MQQFHLRSLLFNVLEYSKSNAGGYGMEIYESAEDYLEAILMLKQRNGHVRSVDVAEELGYSKASISVAMKKLRENGYIAMDKEGITLLPSGEAIAEHIYERHKFFTELFISIGVNPKTAREDACRIEHGISDETFSKLKEALAKLKTEK